MSRGFPELLLSVLAQHVHIQIAVVLAPGLVSLGVSVASVC